MFSIIIPIYNRAHSVEKSINSALNQTYTDFELILVDDCSIDDSVKIVKMYDDSRIRLLQHNVNSGAATARNTGIKESKYDFIVFLDSDDYFEPTFLEETLNVILKSDDSIGFWYTGCRLIINNTFQESTWKPKYIESSYLTILHQLHIGSGLGITIRKIVFQKLGMFRTDLPAAEDTEFFLRITKQFDFKLVDKILINIVRDGDDRMSKNFKNICIAYNKFIEEHLNVINIHKKLQLKYFYKMMWLNYHTSNKSISRNYFKLLIKSNNINLKIVFIFILYEILPIKFASRIHQLYSNY